MFLGFNEEMWGAVATCLSAGAAVLTGWFGYRASGHRAGDPFGRRHPHEPHERVRLVAVDVPAEVYERPLRTPWWRAIAILTAVVAIGLPPFGYAMYQLVASGFGRPEWLGVAFVFGGLGAVSLGWLVGLLQIGFDHAGIHSQDFYVEGDLDLLADRSTEALSRMRVGVRKLDKSGTTVTIEASGVRAPQNVCIRIERRDGRTCHVHVTTTSQPGILSFRRNSHRAARFISELTGVLVYPASFIVGTWKEAAKP